MIVNTPKWIFGQVRASRQTRSASFTAIFFVSVCCHPYGCTILPTQQCVYAFLGGQIRCVCNNHEHEEIKG